MEIRGMIKNYTPDYQRSNVVDFDVNEVHFRHSFASPQNAQGLLHNGMNVRIEYLNDEIIKLEAIE